MRRPHLEFIYRIVAEMDPGASPIPNVHGSAVSRIVLPIAGGTVKGPQIKGEIVKNSGADWAQRIDSPKVSGRLGSCSSSHRISPSHMILS